VKNEIIVNSGAELEAVIHRLIPISTAMGVRVKSFDGSSLELTAPLESNINHQSSAFGGSLTAISALTGWGLVQLQLGRLGLIGNTVVSHSEATFLKPVRSELLCRSRVPDSIDNFEHDLTALGRADLLLLTEIVTPEGTAMTTSSRFVIHGDRRDKP
jgi:thioesterase domain-containing protein